MTTTGSEPPVERPFVDVPVGDVERARRLAVDAAERLGLGEVRLLRHGMNAVFETPTAVLRVGRPTADPSVATAFAECLARVDIRVPRPLVAGRSTEQTGVGDLSDLAVSVWERLEPSGAPIDWERVGAMVALLHAEVDDRAVGSYPCPSPTSLPWWDFDAVLRSSRPLLDDRAVAVLRGVVERHRWWRDAARTDAVVCHGDVHPGNVLQTADGPVLLDWDLLCRAPAGWDHGPMMTWAERWGGAAGEYEAFAVGYGRSFREDPFAEAVAELRLVAATLMRVRAGATDPAARVEAERRLAYWRGEPAAPVWSPQ